MPKYTLNEGQQAAADGFFEFLLDESEKEMIITGPGGSGKTYLEGALIDEVMPHYHQICKMMGIKVKYQDVDMTASTNPAAEQLSNATGRPAGTIFSKCNLVVKNNFQTGETFVAKTKSWCQIHNQVVFVDEFSILDRNAVKQIRETLANCKIVWVGDAEQLGPVNDTSIIAEEMQAGIIRTYELVTQERNKSQPHLSETCTMLRQGVKDGLFNQIQLKKGVIDWITDPDEIQRELATHLTKPDHGLRVIAFTNDVVGEYSEFCRVNLRGRTEIYAEGDRLVVGSQLAVFDRGDRVRLQTDSTVTVARVHDNIGVKMIDEMYKLTATCQTLEILTKYGRRLTVTAPLYYQREVKRAISYLASEREWALMFNLKETYPDFRSADASTTHKAQGASFDTIFIDLPDLLSCGDIDTLLRLIYVAVSRARLRVVFFGELPEDLQELLIPEA